jgi:hypothetical protein
MLSRRFGTGQQPCAWWSQSAALMPTDQQYTHIAQLLLPLPSYIHISKHQQPMHLGIAQYLGK